MQGDSPDSKGAFYKHVGEALVREIHRKTSKS